MKSNEVHDVTKVLLFLYILQADCQLEMQLFKLYHNEQGINNLTNDLKAKARELGKLEKRKVDVEQELKSRKQENAKFQREMAAVDKKISSKVKPLMKLVNQFSFFSLQRVKQGDHIFHMIDLA